MKKRILSILLSASMAASLVAVPTAASAANTPTYQTAERQMEELDRGLVAVKVTSGVYLSWRLLGDEDLATQEYDIYKDGTKIYTTKDASGTNYTDTSGTTSSEYEVVKTGENPTGETVTPWNTNTTSSSSVASYSEKNSMAYMDLAIQNPGTLTNSNGSSCTYTANDASVGDLDGDGDYELILKWDPSDSKDSAGADFTGRVFIDAYDFDMSGNCELMWRIDLGYNVTAGAHYTQFMVYDFDGDGCAEIAMKTAPGSKDGLNTVNSDGTWNSDGGEYVSRVGDTEEITDVDDTASFIGTSGKLKGKNPFTQYLTVFAGESGEALATTEYIPFEAAADAGGNTNWGDDGAKYNRSERYLAGVAYLDGVTPSIIMCRGYYDDAIIRAYHWDGSELTMLWQHSGVKSGSTLYGQGNHNLSIGDIDNDGKDEIVYGSASLDDDGSTIMGNTLLGHGDAMHMSDFNNDGEQEVFSVKEESSGYKYYAMDLRNAATGEHFWDSGKITTSGDNGRGVMDNVDDAYAADHPESGLALGWDSGNSNAVDLNGDDVAAKPVFSSRSGCNFLVYWDGDLGREILDDTLIGKYYAQDGTNSNGYSVSAGTTLRFYNGTSGYTLNGASSNNSTKYNPCLVADLFGDWREEIVMRYGDDALRVYMSTISTTYRLTTLMHDSQYRLSVAWQNVGYNQPTHTSYYIGSVALATDENGATLNYLAPAAAYTNVTYEAPESVAVTGLTLSDSEIRVEKTKSVSLTASLTPSDATKKGITWTSSDPSVATVSNGIVKGVSNGTATITATAKDETNGTFSDTCEVTVYSTPVTGLSLSATSLELGTDKSKKLTASVTPDDATVTSVTWESSDEKIATVDDDGVVTGIAPGSVLITATSVDNSDYTAKCGVTVYSLTTEDYTGTNSFTQTSAADSGTTVSASATGVTITQSEASSGATVEKTFESYDEGSAVLEFHLTTGGQKIDGSNWNWDGHEYTMGMKLLDTDGNNILTVEQPYASKAGTLTSQTGDNEAVGLISNWTTVIDSSGDVQGSAKRWIVTIELDYDNDECTATIVGTDSTWATEAGKYTTTFDLNGASFETLRLYTTLDGTGTITAAPSIAELSYEKYMPNYSAIMSQSFTSYADESTNTLITLQDNNKESYSTTYTGIAGMTLYIGDRDGGDSTTYWAVNTSGELFMTSGQFASASHGPRIKFDTPTISDGETLTAEIDVKIDADGTVLYYNDSTSTNGGTEITGLTTSYQTLSVSITNNGGTYTRTVSLGDTPIASDTGSELPVLWGTNEAGTYTSVYFDNYLLTSDATVTYAINTDYDSAAGTVKVIDADGNAVTEAAAGDVITIAAEPADGYEYDLVVTDVYGIELALDENGSLTMPARDITVTVTFTEKATPAPNMVFLEYDGETATVTGNNVSSAALIYAEYADGVLSAVKIYPLTFTNNTATQAITAANGSKLMVWNSADGMKPLCEAYDVVVETATEEPTATPTTAPTEAPSATPTAAAETSATTSPTATPTVAPTATPTVSPTVEPTVEPTAAPTIDPNVEYETVFTSSESFLMADDSENNKWIVSADGTVGTTAVETTDDIGSNDTAKLYLANKAVQYVLDDAITEGCFKLTYDMYIDKTTNTSSYGRYFRTYLDNAAHTYDAATGQASEYNANYAFFHMMDYSNAVYTTSTTALISATQDSDLSDALKLSETTLEDAKWYRVVIEGDLTNDIVTVAYYAHGDSYNADLDISAETPVISANGCFTTGRTRELKQIKFMRTQGGDLYYDNITLEKQITAE